MACYIDATISHVKKSGADFRKKEKRRKDSKSVISESEGGKGELVVLQQGEQ